MTMDIQTNQGNNRMDISKMPSPKCFNNIEELTHNKKPNSSVKRSFDVAFLMQSDDKKTRREKQVRYYDDESTKIRATELTIRSDLTIKATPPQELLDVKVRLGNNNVSPSKAIDAYNHEYRPKEIESSAILHLTKIYDDPLLSQASSDGIDPPRSAFSKVNGIRTPNRSPIPPPLSPGQMSCPSASPPISSSPPNPAYYPFINGSAFQAINQSQNVNKLKQFMYQQRSPQNTPSPDIPQNYMSPGHPHGFPFFPAVHPLLPQPDGLIRNPATAAILSTFLPTACTSLSLTAQNVCAKCNISFRMTSDLVYHMRSHHKNDFQHDPHRRKREEKLKCNVCSESFRERHHLTRHMTAHQDKEGDLLDGDALLELQARRKRGEFQR